LIPVQRGAFHSLRNVSAAAAAAVEPESVIIDASLIDQN
jgi:hypothetical protein